MRRRRGRRARARRMTVASLCVAASLAACSAGEGSSTPATSESRPAASVETGPAILGPSSYTWHDRAGDVKEFVPVGRETSWTRRPDQHVGDLLMARVSTKGGAVVLRARFVDLRVPRGSELDVLGVIQGRGRQLRSFGLALSASDPHGTSGIYRNDWPGPAVPRGLPGLRCGMTHVVDVPRGKVSITVPGACLGDHRAVRLFLGIEYWVLRGGGARSYVDVPGRHGDWATEDAWSRTSPALVLAP